MTVRGALVLSVFLCIGLAYARSDDREKVAEGRYQNLSNGILSKDTQHTWVLWQTATGYEIEDDFVEPDQFAYRLFQTMGADGGLPMSPELRRQIQSSAVPDHLEMELGSSLQIVGMRLEGKQLHGNTAKIVTILECKNSQSEIKCKGMKGNPKLKTKDAREFFYSFSFPMLFGSLVSESRKTLQHPDTIRMVNVSFDSHQQPQISELDTEIEYMGQDDVHIFDKQFRVGKYSVRMSPKHEESSAYLIWASSDGLVLAVEASKLPGTRQVLVDYKKHLDF